MKVLVWIDESGLEQRQTIAQDRPLVIGREDNCDIVIADARASRRHARVSLAGNVVEIEDLNSSNGTWLAGARIPRGTWEPGQTLEIGNQEFELQGEDAGDIATLPTKVLASGNPARAAARKSGSANFILRHWRGEYSLGRSIFLHTFLVSFALFLIVNNLTEPVAADASPRGRLLFVSVVFLVGLAILIWQIVGIWRSILGAKERGAWLITRVSAGVLVGLLALTIPFSIYEYGVSWNALRAIETGQDSGGRSAYALRVDQNVLYFDGTVVWPLVADFREHLRNNPQIDTIVLKSPGGDTTAGRRISDQLRERGATTFVVEGCASACTLMYVGGTRRAIGAQGQLGFHATSVILMDPMMTRIMNMFTFRHDALNGEVYRRAGISEDFIQRALATPSTDLWVPTHEELLQARVVSEVVR